MKEKKYKIESYRQTYNHIEEIEFNVRKIKSSVEGLILTESEVKVLLSRIDEVVFQIQYFKTALDRNLTEVKS